MNCNPFTSGHLYLIEQAAAQMEKLFVFVVEEDKSEFPFADRIALVKAGTSHLSNVTVLPSGKFIISALTFSDYFNKKEIQEHAVDTSLDVTLFAKEIAPVLGIRTRFAGSEPTDKITRQYNQSMDAILTRYGIKFVEIPRVETDGVPVSASHVRRLLEVKDFEAIAKIVPKTTLDYLMNKF